MSSIIPVGIAGLGRHVPAGRLTNADLEQRVDTTDEWIVQRTGIRERRIAGPDELTSDMGTAAAREAMEDAGLAPADIDLVLCCTVTPDHLFPATACTIGQKLGADRAGGFDVSAACSGWVLGSQIAANFIATGAARNVIVVGVEKLSSIIDYTDRGTCVLFGDGAGAAVFSPLADCHRGEFLGGSAGMRGGSEDVLGLPAGGSRFPATHDTVARGMHFIRMEGRQIFRFAVKTFAELVGRALQGHAPEDLGLVVPHQVNLRIIESAAEQAGIPMDKVFVNIQHYGNTSAASVPMALYEARQQGRLADGKLVCCAAFGAGLTWGHALFRW